MAFTMYDASVPMLVRTLENLSAILAKGQDFAKDNGVDESSLVNARLADDMFPLTRQVQIASDSAKGAGARLAGVDVPSFEDSEATFDELQARVAKTIAFLKSLDESNFANSEDSRIAFSNKGGSYDFNGKDFLFTYALPTFFFHVTTAYDILRHKGVNLGKKDYLGSYQA